MNTPNPAHSSKDSREDIISNIPVKLVDEVISRACAEKASDLHIEPYEHECRVRMRVDGDLVHVGRYKKDIHEEVIARLKVVSSLRTDLRTSPQDGRFRVNVSNVPVHVRISVVPSMFGEKCVLRLLPQGVHKQTLESLGFGLSEQEKIEKALALSHGMILVVGPTGSGKTTTLYTLIQKAHSSKIATVTLEDPIECSIPGVTQIPVQNGGNVTFASALRAVVRQDPDVIMVGEIRDKTTAELSINAALTGHLVFSTLHTNDAVTTLPRLIDIGIEPFLIASTVRMIISQRLVRKICNLCKKESQITESEREYVIAHGGGISCAPETKISRGTGCKNCRDTGYSGRTIVSEVLVPNEHVRTLIMNKAQPDDLLKAALASGMTPLAHQAIAKVLDGVTTFEEITSVCGHLDVVKGS